MEIVEVAKGKEIESDIKLAGIPKEPLTIYQVIESITKDTEDLFWTAINRHKYKVRKHVQLSDFEYDKMLDEAKSKILLIRISSLVMFEIVKEVDSADKKVQKDKKQSIMDKYKTRMEELRNEGKDD